MVGGASKVTQDVPPFMLVDGAPCRIYNINIIGLRRNGFSSERRMDIKRAYRKLYRSGLPLREAYTRLKENADNSADVTEILDFLSGGEKKRGFCPWPMRSGKEAR